VKNERRIATRYSTSVPAGMKFPVGRFSEGWGRIVNISSSGIRIETRFPIKVGSILYISFSLRDGLQFDNLRAHAVRVGYQEGYYTAGINFDDLVDQHTLRDVLLALLAEGGIRPL